MTNSLIDKKNKERAEIEEAMKNYKGPITVVDSTVRNDPNYKRFVISKKVKTK